MRTRNILFPFMLLAVAATTLTSCKNVINKVAMKAVEESVDFEKEDTAKWGRVVEQDIDLPAFSAIEAKGVTRIVFTQDTVCSVRVRGNEKCIAEYKFTVRKDELKVEYTNFSGNVNKRTPGVTLFVTAPSLSAVEVSGAGKLEMPEPIEQAGALKVELEGAGEVSISDLTLESLNIEISGAGKCALGKVVATDDIEIEVNGAGDVKADVYCQELSVEINGAGNAVVSGECIEFSCSQNGASKIDTSNLRNPTGK